MKKAIAVIGEGITEKYYIESLKGLTPFTLYPRELGRKASSLIVLEKNIKEAIEDGYDEVFILVDMDNKAEGKNKIKYEQLKGKYHGKECVIKKKGISCKVTFIETERCLELWFLFHFTKKTITREFSSYADIERELRKYRKGYGKYEKYFRSIGNIHEELTTKTPKGSLKRAVENSISSDTTRRRDGRSYTYSEMHVFITALKIELD